MDENEKMVSVTDDKQSQDTVAEQKKNTAEQQAAESSEKTFTQAELDKVVADRLKREKSKLPAKEELEAFRKWQEENKTAEQKTAEEIKAAQKARTAAEQRAEQLEAKYTAMAKGVKADAVDDVIALAKAKANDSVTLEKAIDIVLTRYPHFCGKPATTGVTTPNNDTGKNDDALLRKVMGLSTKTS